MKTKYQDQLRDKSTKKKIYKKKSKTTKKNTPYEFTSNIMRQQSH